MDLMESLTEKAAICLEGPHLAFAGNNYEEECAGKHPWNG